MMTTLQDLSHPGRPLPHRHPFEAGQHAAFGDADAERRSARANRRRLAVFLGVFVLLSAIGLGYVYSRPAVYEATARLSLQMPAGRAAASEPARAADEPHTVRDEVQFLTSRTLLAEVAQRLTKASAAPLPAASGADPAATLQAMLTATPLEGTNVVLLRARGGQPEFLSSFLDTLLDAYRQSLAERWRGASADTLVEAADEARKLEAGVLAKRRQIDAFRARHNIVSLERDENQVLAGVKGTGAALNAANDKVVAAQARLDALQEAVTAGRTVARAKDNPTLAAIEQQAAGVRADLKALERRFTPQYMQIDPNAKALQERLVELDQQLVLQRRASQQDTLQEAREELAGARGAAATLRQQLAANQSSVQTFTSRFNEYRALQDELTQTEQMRQKAALRLAAIEAQEAGRRPKAEVIEPAATPQSPVSPWYARDAALALGGALIAGLLAMGIVELFNRPPRQPQSIVMPQAWVPVAMGSGGVVAALGTGAVHDALPDARAASAALPAPAAALPRELADAESRALLDTADRDLRGAVALLLLGLAPREVVDLRCDDVDRANGCVRVRGADARTVAVPPNVLALLDDGEQPVEAPLFARRTEADLDAALLYAAHDAGVEHAGEVTAQSLRHTGIVFLVRQGMRFSELAQIVGRLDADLLAAYSRLAPAGPRQSAETVDRLPPALRALAAG